MKTPNTNYKNPILNKEQVKSMFNNIAPKYDALNKIISLKQDIRWRKKVFSIVQKHPHKTILDVATGTGDLALSFSILNTHITAIDISKDMIDLGREKAKIKASENNIDFLIGDAENLTFKDDTFDVVSVGFGVRNFENLGKGIDELKRVLKPNGLLIILETSIPKNIFLKLGYYLHNRLTLPILGKIFARNKQAYSYLANSARKFPSGNAFMDILGQLGLKKSKQIPLSFGAVSIYCAYK